MSGLGTMKPSSRISALAPWFDAQTPIAKAAVFLAPAVRGVVLTSTAVAGQQMKTSLALATITGVLFGGASKVYGGLGAVAAHRPAPGT